MKRALVSILPLPLPLVIACGPTAPPPVTSPPPVVPPLASVPVTAAPAPTFVPALPYPASRRVDQVDALHGVAVADPYRWLEDGASDEVRTWGHAEDALARTYLARLPDRDAMAARMRELFYVERELTPVARGRRLFYARRDAGKEKYVVYVRDGARGAERVLLDPGAWSADGSAALGEWSASWDGKKVAYTVKANNADEAVLYVVDVATLAKSAIDVIPGTGFASVAWTPSGDGFYYERLPPLPAPPAPPDADRMKHLDLRFHLLGKDPASDTVVRGETGDAQAFLGASLSRDGRWLFAAVSHGWSRNDVYFEDLRAPKPSWRVLVEGRDAHFDIDADRGAFFVRTNLDAPRYRLLRVDPAHPEPSAWREIVAEREDATLDSVAVIGHRLGLAYLKDVVAHPEIHDENGKLLREVPLPAVGSMGAWSGDADSDEAFYAFQSFTYPPEIFDEQVSTGKRSTFYKVGVPVDATKYVVTQLFATSKDGTRVPFFVVRGKDAPRDGVAPTILEGYGGFQIAETPFFASSLYPWLERGGTWAFANLRGGSEYGEPWHRHGMLHEKQHVFDDFFAVAEELTAQRITSPSKLAIYGGSNGGLLIGAAVTQRPDLFRVALCEVPLLDMVRYPLFGIGKQWIGEYGSPDDADDFKALFAYSPYHHVVSGTRYPATLVLSADSDDRVDPMHARKFAAALQAASTGGPVLLRVEQRSGHGGADLVRANVEKIADEYAFALEQMR